MEKLDLVGELLYKWRIKNVFPLIEGKLLDLGCGTNQIVKKYGNGTGIDVYQFGGADLIIEDTSKTPFADNSFNTITILAALNHIPNRREVLQEMYRILKPGGKIIITMITPKISRIWHFIRGPFDRDQKERGMKMGEVYGMTSKEVKQLLRNCNFEDIKEKKFMLGINNITIAKK